jgi:hypothetical protein
LDVSVGSISVAVNAFPWDFSAGLAVMLAQPEQLDTITIDSRPEIKQGVSHRREH